MITLQIGDKAPAISLKNQDGKKITLASLKGKKVAVFFYPKDDTPTCTNEACNLRDN
jgi:thioredoxin-dependent peroxiredoxin